MPKILVVDDDEAFRTMIVGCLQKKGHEVSECQGGEEALRRFNILDFELLVTDIMMRDGDGIELIRNLEKLTPELPVIAISGGAMHLNPQLLGNVATRLGARAFLAKPFDLEEFTRLVAKFTAPREVVKSDAVQ